MISIKAVRAALDAGSVNTKRGASPFHGWATVRKTDLGVTVEWCGGLGRERAVRALAAAGMVLAPDGAVTPVQE